MSLAVRIIPVLLTSHGKLVKGEKFNSSRVVGHAQQAAEIHQSRNVDELLVLDVSATPEGRGPDLKAVEKLAENCFMPLTIGGGVKMIEDFRDLLLHGADKIALCTAAYTRPRLVYEAAQRYGSNAVVVSIDFVRTNNKWCVVTNCGKAIHLEHCAEEFARKMDDFGAGEIILNSVERDGTMQGYDLELIERVASKVRSPVVAAGGCGSYQHMLDAINAGASAVAVGAFFQWEDATPRDAAKFLAKHGLETRL